MKQIDAGVLDIGYAEEGPKDGPVVILLHGLPYDIYSFAEVAAILASQNYRVIVPYLRGDGTTRFLDSSALRNGQPSLTVFELPLQPMPYSRISAKEGLAPSANSLQWTEKPDLLARVYSATK